MNNRRKVVFFGRHLGEFYDPLRDKVKEKIDHVLYLIQVAPWIPKKFFKLLEGTDGLYEIRVLYAGNAYRIFCCFDEGKLVILFNGFHKKSQKTPKKEIDKALIIRKAYFSPKK